MTLTKNDITGLYTAIVTPFNSDKSVDHKVRVNIPRCHVRNARTLSKPVWMPPELPPLSPAFFLPVFRMRSKPAGTSPKPGLPGS